MNRGSSFDRLVHWLENKQESVPQIDIDLDLIENRVVDSLELMDFILMIEQLSGREIDIEETQLDTFRTLRSIRSTFFPALAVG